MIRGMLALFFLAGLGLALYGGGVWIALQSEMDKPAIVIAPQLILAMLSFALGLILAAVSAGLSLLIERAEAIEEALVARAAQAAKSPEPAVEAAKPAW